MQLSMNGCCSKGICINITILSCTQLDNKMHLNFKVDDKAGDDGMKWGRV